MRNTPTTGAALTTGIIGTALGVLNGGLGILGGGFGCHASNYVSKDELKYVQELAAKDSQIALLQSEANTEVKIADVYERVMSKVNANHESQAAINQAQAVFNSQIGSQVAINTSNIAQLMGMTKLFIPSENVTPEPMNRYNSWTAPTV